MERELLDLLCEVKKGDQDACFRLRELYGPLIESMSAGFLVSFVSACGDASIGAQDLAQEASMALFRAAESYDAAQENVSFGLYAKICIRNALVSELRRVRAASRKKQRALREKVSVSVDPLETLALWEDSTGLKERIDPLLSPYEKKILDLYICGKSVKNISSCVGKTEKSVSNALYRVREKVKDLLES